MIVPAGQESELAGFFLYCTQILTWLPPLVLTVLNESGIHLRYGGFSLNIYLLLSCVFYHVMSPFDECKEAAQTNKMRKVEDKNPLSNENHPILKVEDEHA